MFYIPLYGEAHHAREGRANPQIAWCLMITYVWRVVGTILSAERESPPPSYPRWIDLPVRLASSLQQKSAIRTNTRRFGFLWRVFLHVLAKLCVSIFFVMRNRFLFTAIIVYSFYLWRICTKVPPIIFWIGSYCVISCEQWPIEDKTSATNCLSYRLMSWWYPNLVKFLWIVEKWVPGSIC